MNQTAIPTQHARRSVSSSAADTRLCGGLLILARGGWIAVVTLTVGCFIAALPMLSRQLQTVCVRARACPSGGLSPTALQTIHTLGFSVSDYAVYMLSLYSATALVWCAVGLLIFWRKSDDWMALLVALFLVMFNLSPGLGQSAPAFVYPVWNLPLQFLSFLAVIPLGLFFLLFPTGRFVPRWTGWFAVALLALAIPRYCFPTSPFDFTTWPGGLNVLASLSIIGILLFAQLYRYWRVSDLVQRQQTRWVVFGITTALVVFLAGEGFYLLFPTVSQPGSLYSFGFETVIPLVLLAIPLSIGIAVLRYRLWNLDVVINRTLVYGLLTASVIGLYVLCVGGLGTALQTRGNLLITMLATGLVSILFQPLRTWLQRGVNRLMYGQRDEPYVVVARLGRRLESTLAPEAVLTAIAETVAQALKLPYASITLKQGEDFKTAAVYGSPVEEPFTLPLSYQAEPVGQLVLGPRKPGEAFTPADRRLLEDLARQVGMAAHAVRLTGDLQRSRTQLVTTREEERRRLRRDLHDGLGPTLAALALKATTVSDLISTDPAAATQLSNELYADIRATVGEIRRLVYALRPPLLDELGLLEAIREAARQQNRPDGLQITVDAPERLPTLPAAVEVAAYRILQEALTNVARHAHARSCTVRLTLAGAVQVEILDDGVGIPPEQHSGVGLLSMRERAIELGGTCLIERNPGAGTRVYARLPVSLPPQEEADGVAARADC